MPLADPGGLQQLELPGPDAAALDRRVRACDRLTQAASEHKTRIKDLVRQLMPMTPLTGDLGKADLAVLEHYADPRALLAAGVAELTTLITTVSHHQQGHDRACQWRAAAAAAVELYGDHPAVPYEELAAEVATEVRLLRAIQAELAAHAAAREAALPAGRSRASSPGRCPGSPRSAPRSWSPPWAGPAASATEPGSSPMPGSPPGQRDRRDRPQRPADEQGRALPAARHVLRAADTARQQDPQLARIYYLQMTERGATHLKACCVVAGHLAERAWAVLQPRHPLRDLRQQRQPRHPSRGQKDHRGEVDRPRGRPQTPPQPQDSGEGPSGGHNRAGQTRRPPPPPIVTTPRPGRQARHLTQRQPHQPAGPADGPVGMPATAAGQPQTTGRQQLDNLSLHRESNPVGATYRISRSFVTGLSLRFAVTGRPWAPRTGCRRYSRLA